MATKKTTTKKNSTRKSTRKATKSPAKNTASNGNGAGSKWNLAELTENVDTKKAAAAVGVAAVAAAGIALLKKGDKETRLEVRPAGDGWGVFLGGGKTPEATFDVKDEAIAAGREMAHSNQPSLLSIHRMDGTEQDTHRYTAG